MDPPLQDSIHCNAWLFGRQESLFGPLKEVLQGCRFSFDNKVKEAMFTWLWEQRKNFSVGNTAASWTIQQMHCLVLGLCGKVIFSIAHGFLLLKLLNILSLYFFWFPLHVCVHIFSSKMYHESIFLYFLHLLHNVWYFYFQPLCDGSHKKLWGTSQKKNMPKWQPLRFKVEETKEYWLCNCKQTDKQPFCDGTHKQPHIQAAVKWWLPLFSIFNLSNSSWSSFHMLMQVLDT